MNINIINSLLFHPRKSFENLSDNDILINVGNNVSVGIKLFLKNKLYNNILFFHGNGEISSEYNEIAQIYNNNNINFIVADYRGYGFSNGEPNIENLQCDCHFILDFLIKYFKKNDYKGNLVLMGRSLGSASVIELSKRYPQDFTKLIIESGFANEDPLLKLFGINDKFTEYNQNFGFHNQNKIKKYNGPLLIIHAELDNIIPFNQAQILYNSSPSNNKNIIQIANANHNNILTINPKKYFAEIISFIK